MENKAAYFDLDTIALLREVLEEAWARVPHRDRETIARSLLAERILKVAALGERDSERLINAAMTDGRNGRGVAHHGHNVTMPACLNA